MRVQRILFITLILFFNAIMLFAMGVVDVTVTGGSWDIDLDATALSPANTAGANFPTYRESAANLADVDITGVQVNGRYWMTIERTAWAPVPPVTVTVYARRTGDGVAGGGSQPSITGGTTYQEVTTSPLLFFSGRRTRTNIPVQMRVDGLTVLLGVNTYVTTITYTILNAAP